MTPERWRQIDELYHAARERGPDVLANADPEAKRKVEAMLAQDTARGGVLDRPAAEALSGVTEVSAGTLLGPYRIETPIGKGGMGEVWKARDTRLNRDVAIKFSSQQFTDRFEREAHAIAALNHSNVCTLHDVGPNFLVMELVEGPTLAERMKRGRIPLEEALRIARQIADALEAAHEKGFVHRDLKPANIKIRPDGSVKVLDFGLAKEAEPGPDSPTALSLPGLIMGTPGYMSPEQARGEKVDKRTDIWAFGVVLYEMVTGQRLREPEWERVPAGLQRVLRLCLEKDATTRLHDIADAKLLLDGEVASSAPSRSRFGKAGWVAAGAATIIAGAVSVLHFREKPPETPLARFTIRLPEKTTFIDGPALSGDGRRLVFTARSEDGSFRLWVRSLDATTAQPLAGAEGGNYPFWSPDGRSIGFAAGGKLKKIDFSGGPAVTLANVNGLRGASWSPLGVIVFAPTAFGPLRRIPAAGGAETPVTALDPARKENTHRWPWFLPDGRHFLYSATVINTNDATIYVGSLDSHETRIVAQANSNAVYASGPSALSPR
jgi:predicted Ser/Thr protein kinase